MTNYEKHIDSIMSDAAKQPPQESEPMEATVNNFFGSESCKLCTRFTDSCIHCEEKFVSLSSKK